MKDIPEEKNIVYRKCNQCDLRSKAYYHKYKNGHTHLVIRCPEHKYTPLKFELLDLPDYVKNKKEVYEEYHLRRRLIAGKKPKVKKVKKRTKPYTLSELLDISK